MKSVHKLSSSLVLPFPETGPADQASSLSMLLPVPCRKNAEQNHKMKTDNGSFENVTKLRYFGMTVTNKISIHKEIKSRLTLGNACCNLVRNILSSGLLLENLKIRIY
jgi:hypothetical protein